ncbi:TPA: hypothetical protein ACPZAW_003580 [Yersinia enterocolitica]|nr:hypothetical protein [Yersinia enterocolitica]
MMKKRSENPDAVCHRDRRRDNGTFGFLEKKVYLGSDTRHKIALISQKLTGAKVGPRKFAADKAGDIISACINHMYNTLFNDECRMLPDLKEHPKISPAMSPKSIEIYDVYQHAKGRFDILNTCESKREMFASVATKFTEYGFPKPRAKALSEGEQWIYEDIAWICDPVNINDCIDRHNQKYADLQTSKSGAVQPD